MARLSKIENGVIVNQIVGDPADFPEYIDHTGTRYGRGWTDNGDGTFSPPPPKEPPIERVDRSEFVRFFRDSSILSIIEHSNAQVRGFWRKIQLLDSIEYDDELTTKLDALVADSEADFTSEDKDRVLAKRRP